jgi:hypothetical protein
MCAPFHPRSKWAHAAVIIGCAAGLALLSWLAISVFWQSQPAEDLSYLRPIPKATQDAFRPGDLVQTKLQAVLAAQRVSGPHFKPIGVQTVISAAKCRINDAERRVTDATQVCAMPYPGETFIWLVVLDGNWSIQPPPALNAPSPTHVVSGCTCVFVPPDPGKAIGTHFESCPCH